MPVSLWLRAALQTQSLIGSRSKGSSSRLTSLLKLLSQFDNQMTSPVVTSKSLVLGHLRGMNIMAA